MISWWGRYIGALDDRFIFFLLFPTILFWIVVAFTLGLFGAGDISDKGIDIIEMVSVPIGIVLWIFTIYELINHIRIA